MVPRSIVVPLSGIRKIKLLTHVPRGTRSNIGYLLPGGDPGVSGGHASAPRPAVPRETAKAAGAPRRPPVTAPAAAVATVECMLRACMPGAAYGECAGGGGRRASRASSTQPRLGVGSGPGRAGGGAHRARGLRLRQPDRPAGEEPRPQPLAPGADRRPARGRRARHPRAGTADRRAVLVALTAAGWALAGRITAARLASCGRRCGAGPGRPRRARSHRRVDPGPPRRRPAPREAAACASRTPAATTAGGARSRARRTRTARRAGEARVDNASLAAPPAGPRFR